MVKNILHVYIKKSINLIVDCLFLIGFRIYMFLFKLWHKYLKRITFQKQADFEIAHENEDNIRTDNDPLKNIDIDWNHYIWNDFWGLKIDNFRNVVKIINKKNEFKQYASNFMSYLIQTISILFIIYFFSFNDDAEDMLNNKTKTNNSKSNIFWHYAEIKSRKYDTFQEMMAKYEHVLYRKCTELTEEEIKTRRINDSYEITDLTFLYHALCHEAIDQSLHTKSPAVITPKILNISNYRSENYDIPMHLFDKNYTTIKDITPPNLCLLAIAIPENSKKTNDDHHTHSSQFSFENAFNKDLPPGIFIHSSKAYKNENVSYFDVNPIMHSNTSEIWSSYPMAGRCAIFVNPKIYENEDDLFKFSILHSSSLIKEQKKFETVISNFTLFYHDVLNFERSFSSISKNLLIQLQTIWNIMISNNIFIINN